MKILLLAGSGEGRRLAKRLHDAGHDVLASLAGATQEAVRYDCDVRTGGFGGDQGFQDFLTSFAPDAVIDATHPFAHQISKRTHRICEKAPIPYLQVLRSEWVPGPSDQWVMINAPVDAHRHIPKGSTVFLATGRQTLKEFGNLSDSHLICRQIDPPDGPFPFPNGEFLIGRPPFSISDETRLFKQLEIDVLVVKNAGGDASRSKLDAARALNIPVVMINRPPRLDAEIVATVEGAMDWVARFADN
jgi:precorrin-6A/cobalt-precorrin-6A reductase